MLLVHNNGLVAEEGRWFDQAEFPVLLRAARRTYATAVRDALAAMGYDDLPRNGPYVIGGIALAGAPLSAIIARLGVSKQAAGQLVDTLVIRGYLNRSVDTQDRRQLKITLTERGLEAATIIRSAVDRVDDELLRRVGRETVELALMVLASLIEGEADATEGR
jgi:DNA-binding MarR family transcriptional regulator